MSPATFGGWFVFVGGGCDAGGFLWIVGRVAGDLVALGFGHCSGIAECRCSRCALLGAVKSYAGGGVENAADGPGHIFAGKEYFAGALLLGTVVPAAEEREVIGEGGEVKG